uniref:Uncharacterized protein n=1 Tax=Rhizophora mucronata TaxID=61149 RepID=A0A2P2NIB9_RHIMU
MFNDEHKIMHMDILRHSFYNLFFLHFVFSQCNGLSTRVRQETILVVKDDKS